MVELIRGRNLHTWCHRQEAAPRRRNSFKASTIALEVLPGSNVGSASVHAASKFCILSACKDKLMTISLELLVDAVESINFDGSGGILYFHLSHALNLAEDARFDTGSGGFLKCSLDVEAAVAENSSSLVADLLFDLPSSCSPSRPSSSSPFPWWNRRQISCRHLRRPF